MQFLRSNTTFAAKITLPGPFTMTQQAKNEFYKDDEEMAMDFAAAVNAEALDLQAAGADVIQLDEPWLRNDPEAAKRYAVRAINRALEGITVPTVVHLCFGYAAVVPGQKPSGYSFLPGLADSHARQISIKAAQPRLDLGVLSDLAGRKIMLGVLDLGGARRAGRAELNLRPAKFSGRPTPESRPAWRSDGRAFRCNRSSRHPGTGRGRTAAHRP